jgi:hypothetical protein
LERLFSGSIQLLAGIKVTEVRCLPSSVTFLVVFAVKMKDAKIAVIILGVFLRILAQKLLNLMQ